MRLPGFRWLWCAHLISMLGDGLYSVALPWLVWEHTRSGVATAATLATSAFTFLVVGPIAGVYVDRWDRRATLIGADLLRAATLTLMPLILLWHYSLAVALVVAVLVPAFSRFFTPAQRASVPSLVPGNRLVAANAFMQGAGNAAFIGGPAVAGLLIAISGPVALLFIDAASFVASAAFLSLVQLPSVAPPSAARRSVRADLVHGFRLTWQIPGLRAVSLVAVFGTVCVAPVTSLLPLWVGGSGSGGAWTYGLLTSCIFVGSLAGSVAVARGGRLLQREGLIVVSLLAMGIAIAAFGSAHQTVAGAFALIAQGAFLSSYNVGVMTLLQRLSPEGTMGRIFAVNETFSWSLRSVAVMAAGALAERAGVHGILIGLGCGLVIVGGAAAASPSLRAVGAA